MFYACSQKIAEKLISQDIISFEKKNIYVYGLELLLSSIAGILALITVSLIVKAPLLWIPYLAGFIPLRLTGGGYHAKSHIGCISIFTTAYIMSLFLISQVSISRFFVLIATIVVFILILIFSPVEACNKPLSKERKKSNRNKSIFLALGNIVFAIITVIFQLAHFRFISLYFIGNVAAAVSMVVVMIINMWKRRDNL